MGMEGPKAAAITETIAPYSHGNAIAAGGTARLLFAAAATTIGGRSGLCRDDNGHCIDGGRCERHDLSLFFDDTSVRDDYDEGHPLIHGVEGVPGFECGGGDDLDVCWGGAGGDGAVA